MIPKYQTVSLGRSREDFKFFLLSTVSRLEINRNSQAVDSAFKTESDVLNEYDQFIDKTRDQIIEMDYLEDEEDNPKEKDTNNQS